MHAVQCKEYPNEAMRRKGRSGRHCTCVSGQGSSQSSHLVIICRHIHNCPYSRQGSTLFRTALRLSRFHRITITWTIHSGRRLEMTSTLPNRKRGTSPAKEQHQVDFLKIPTILYGLHRFLQASLGSMLTWCLHKGEHSSSHFALR